MLVRASVAVLAVAGLSLLLVAPAPSYDPWAWLLWGRELTGLELSTEEGPAFKPLPVAICALLAPLGSVAPIAWVLLARAGSVAAVVLAYRLARELAGGSRAAGLLAGAGVALTTGYLGYAATGSSEGLLLALGLGAVAATRCERHRVALACVAGAALLRVEAWPFALAYAAWRWRARPAERPALAALAVAVPALWLVPEWLASGDPLRSGDRARVPNPGQPALADVPAWASLRAAVELALWPVWVGVAALAAIAWRAGRDQARGVARHGGRDARLRLAVGLAAAGAAWVLLVAAMAQAGFSGEPRYALPGIALLTIAAAGAIVGLPGRAFAPGLAVAAAALAVAAVPRLAVVDDVRTAQRYQAELAADLRAAIDDAGGTATLLELGRPVVGHLRGPLLAYALDVPKQTVGFDPRAVDTGVLFASRRTPSSPVEPPAPPGAAPLARNGTWTLLIRAPEYTPPSCPPPPSPRPAPCSPSSSPPAAETRPATPAKTSVPSSPPPSREPRTPSTSNRSPTA